MIWAGGRGGGTSHPGLALGKFLTHRLAGENRRFFKHPGKSECVSDLCDFLTRTSIVQSKSLTTPPVRVGIDVSPCKSNQSYSLLCNKSRSRYIYKKTNTKLYDNILCQNYIP